MGLNAFNPCGNTVAFSATTSAPTPIQASSTTLGGNQYRVLNSGTVTVFMGVGTSSSDATNNATVISTTGKSIPLLSGTDEIMSFPPNAYFTGITSSGTAVIYVTPGDGL